MMSTEKSNSRRAFFKKGISTLAVVAGIQQTVKADDGSPKIKMLTPDGKLVEVSQSVFTQAQKKKATNKDIQEWVTKKS
jgi:hypothetical protein